MYPSSSLLPPDFRLSLLYIVVQQLNQEICHLTANCKDFVKYDFFDTFGSTESENNQHQLPKLQGVAFQKNHEKIIKDTRLYSSISLQIVQCSNFSHLFGRKSNFACFLLNQIGRNYHNFLILMLNIYSKPPYSWIGSDLEPWPIQPWC